MNEGQAMHMAGRKAILVEQTASAKALQWEYAGGIQQEGQWREKPDRHPPTSADCWRNHFYTN